MIGNIQKWKEQKYAQKKTYVENAVGCSRTGSNSWNFMFSKCVSKRSFKG